MKLYPMIAILFNIAGHQPGKQIVSKPRQVRIFRIQRYPINRILRKLLGWIEKINIVFVRQALEKTSRNFGNRGCRMRSRNIQKKAEKDKNAYSR